MLIFRQRLLNLLKGYSTVRDEEPFSSLVAVFLGFLLLFLVIEGQVLLSLLFIDHIASMLNGWCCAKQGDSSRARACCHNTFGVVDRFDEIEDSEHQWILSAIYLTSPSTRAAKTAAFLRSNREPLMLAADGFFVFVLFVGEVNGENWELTKNEWQEMADKSINKNRNEMADDRKSPGDYRFIEPRCCKRRFHLEMELTASLRCCEQQELAPQSNPFLIVFVIARVRTVEATSEQQFGGSQTSSSPVPSEFASIPPCFAWCPAGKSRSSFIVGRKNQEMNGTMNTVRVVVV